MTDTDDTHSRRHFLRIASTIGVTAIAGCGTSGADGDNRNTPEDNSTPTPEPDKTTPGSNTTETTPDPAETPQNNTETPEEKTREEKNPGPNYDNLEQVINNELIGNDVAAFIDTHWEEIGGYLENKDYNSQNPELTENFIETVLTACSEVPWKPDQNTGAQASAHILYNKLDVSPDDVLVAARTRNDAGHPTPITSILTQTTGPKNGYKKYLYQHRENEHAAKGTGDYSGAKPEGDNSLLLSPSEKPTSITEKAFADMWNPDVPGTTTVLDPRNIISRLKDRNSEGYEIIPERTQEGIAELNDNIVVGSNFENESQITYTNDAYDVIGEILDPNNINENPSEVGKIAHDLVSEISMKFYNGVQPRDNTFLAVDFTGNADADISQYSFEDFDFNYVDEKKKEKIEENLLKDELAQFKG